LTTKSGLNFSSPPDGSWYILFAEPVLSCQPMN
jgi:hypothetical protein